jgi:hypothetical protein
MVEVGMMNNMGTVIVDMIVTVTDMTIHIGMMIVDINVIGIMSIVIASMPVV